MCKLINVLFQLFCFLHACMTIHVWPEIIDVQFSSLIMHDDTCVTLNNRCATFMFYYIDCRELVEKGTEFCDHLLSGALVAGGIQRYETKATLSGGFMKVLCTLNMVSCHYFRWCDTRLMRREMNSSKWNHVCTVTNSWWVLELNVIRAYCSENGLSCHISI